MAWAGMAWASLTRAAHSVTIATIALILGAVSFDARCWGSDVEGSPNTSISVDAYERLLAQYVDGQGMVDYAALKAARTDLDEFVHALGELDPETFAARDADARLAFWINAYNAITLQRIIDHYPIVRGGIVRAVVYPANSIRQIDGVWTTLTTPVMGQAMTLDHIEHEIMRKEFNEPRLHAAIVCAAKGCPPLRAEAFRAEYLDRQLDEQCRRFLGEPHRFRVDRTRDIVYISPILSWFSEDFVNAYGVLGRIGRHDDKDSAALHFVRQFVDPADAEYIDTGTYGVRYLGYDWSLNEQQP